jgi:hypothetical protein
MYLPKTTVVKGTPNGTKKNPIDISAGESRGTIRESESVPLALTVGDKDITRNEFGTTENNPGLEAF